MLRYGKYSLVIRLAVTLMIEVLTALTDHVLMLVVHVVVLMLLVEARIGAPIDETGGPCSLYDHFVVGAKCAHYQFILWILPLAIMP